MRITIVGGGISGLSLAYYLLRENSSLDIAVLEAEERPGGKIWTDRAEGFLCESGVNGFLDNRPKTLKLISDLSLNPVRSNDSARKRFIYSGEKLHSLPETPPAFLKSGLLSLQGRLRILYELITPRGTKDDESLADFARRRLGKEAYEKLIDPMASGIYAGDAEALSLRSCFPRIHELEQEYGSLIRALLKLRKKDKGEGKPAASAGPGGILTSFYDGMEAMIAALKTVMSKNIKTNCRVSSLDKKAQQYILQLADGSVMESDVVVIATPAYAASDILKTFDKDISEALNEIPYPSVSVVCTGYKKDKVSFNLDGFGFLVPSTEKKHILGTLWDSSIFPNRAPDGYVLLRSMIGGAKASELALQDEGRLMMTVTDELRRIMGIRAQPDFARVYVHRKAIPQYLLGHQKKLRIIYDLLVKYKHLYLTGNAYKGISVNDCIENSSMLAKDIIS